LSVKRRKNALNTDGLLPLGLRNRNLRFGADNIRLFLYGCLVTIILSFFAIFPPSFVQYANNKSYDIMMRALPAPPPSQIPVLVGIDDQSLSEYGQWPWPRYLLARLVNKIGASGADGIALDMMFPEPDRTSLSVVCGEISREWGISFSDTQTAKQHFENDQVFADALQATPSVLGYQFKFDKKISTNDEILHPLKYTIREQIHKIRKCRLVVADSVVHSLPLLMNAAGASGFVNALTDSDGVLRRVPLLTRYHDRIYPSLSLASLIKAQGNDQVRIETGEDGLYVEWKDKRIPLDCSGFFLVRYRDKTEKFSYMSAGDILSGRTPAGAMSGKVAIIGVTASGMGDRHLSPLDTMIHGVEVHASILDNILTGDFIRRPTWAPGAELILMAGAGLFSSAALATGGALWCLFSTIIAGLATGTIFYWMFLTQGIFLSPILPMFTLLINFAVLNTVKYRFEERKVRQRSLELIMSQDVAILSMSSLVEARDTETGHHILRTQRYVQALARRMRRLAKYRKVLNGPVIELLYKSSPLHDIGKVGIPDSILNKAGSLTADEFEVMKTHTLIGGQTIQKSRELVGGKIEIPYFKYAYEVIISHHEKWDGSGYPYGLKGEAIPLPGRLMALADVYDALISKRVYKPAYSHESARLTILEGKGRHFDPDVVDAFVEEEETFKQIARELSDIG